MGRDSSIDRSELERQFSQLTDSLVNLSPVMPAYRQVIDASIQRSFQTGGRFGNDNEYGGGPQHWIPSRRAREQGGQTLLDTGQLAASITVTTQGDTVTVGSNKAYFGIHQFGGVINHPGGTKWIRGPGGRARFVKNSYKGRAPIAGITGPHQISIIARPIVTIQDEDIEDMHDITTDYYSGLR